MTTWKEWADSVPDEPERERYTATLLYTLSRVLETAPFEWALVGGTALQSYFDEPLRRYSSDVEIITKATKTTVAAWFKEQKWKPEPVGNAPILKAELTPDGKLFVIHDYDAAGYAATEPKVQVFRHFPIKDNPPPGQLKIPIACFDFLVAAKLWELRKPLRGGERFKDAHDLSIGLPQGDSKRVLAKLEAYHKIRGDTNSAKETIRSASAWTQHLQGTGRAAYAVWQPQYLNDVALHDIDKGLATLADALLKLHGSPAQPSPLEQRRFLLAEVSPKQLTPIAKTWGWDKDGQYENMRDYVGQRALAKAKGPAPTDAAGLMAELASLKP